MEYAGNISSFWSKSKLPAIGLAACLVAAANALAINSPALGIATLAVVVVTASLTISRMVFGDKKLSLDNHVISVLAFLTTASVIIAPFAIFSNFTSIHFAALQVAIGIGIYFLSSRYGVKGSNFNLVMRILPRKELILLAIVAAALAVDFAVLLNSRSDIFNWVWQKIPQSHFTLLFISSLAAVAYVVLSRSSNSVKLGVIMAHSLLIESYIALAVATLPGSDNWYMLGEINGAITGTTTYESLSAYTTSVGGITLPAVFILGWGRGLSNGLVIFVTQYLQIPPHLIFAWITPVFFSIFAKAVAYRMGKLLSNDERYSLILSLALSFGVFIMFFMASTTKLSVGFTFLLLGIYLWINYVASNSRRNLLAAVAFLAISLMNYSLFFIALSIFAVLSVTLVKTRNLKLFRSYKKAAIVSVITMAMVLAVPVVDTLEKTRINWSRLSPEFLGENMRDFILDKSGLLYPETSLGSKDVFPQGNILVNNLGWVIASVFLWIAAILGLLSWRKFNKDTCLLLLWFAFVVHASWFVVLYAGEGVKPVGNYLRILTDLVKVPFIAMGLVWMFNFTRYRLASITFAHYTAKPESVIPPIPYAIPRRLFIAVPVLAILLTSITVVSFQTIETRFTNLRTQDVLAAEFIAQTPEKYAVITDLFAAGPIYAFSNGQVNAGGFLVEYIPGGKVDVRTNQFLYELGTSDDIPKTLQRATEETGACMIYVLLPSYRSYTEVEYQRLVDNLGPYITFGDTKTRLFVYDACP